MEKEDLNYVDSYISRIRGFNDGLITWGITWNAALIGAAFLKPNETGISTMLPWLPLAGLFALNILMFFLYSNGLRMTKILVDKSEPMDFKKTYGIKTQLSNRRILLTWWIVLQIVVTDVSVRVYPAYLYILWVASLIIIVVVPILACKLGPRL